MRWNMLSLVLALSFGWTTVPAPVYADEPKDSDTTSVKEDEVSADSSSDEKDKDKPVAVRRLVELEIDPFLVAQRALNIPIPGRSHTFRELLDRLSSYAEDEEVGAVLLNLKGVSLGLSDVEELRDGLAKLRKADKKVMAYLNSGDPFGYLLACSADEIAIAPTGNLIIPGFGMVFPFMRGMYQMQGIEYDVITAGKFKYPGFVNSREPNKYFIEEYGSILDSWYGDYVGMIAKGRNLSERKVKELIDKALFEAVEAKNNGLVDEISYYEDYRDRLLRRTKFKKSGWDGSEMSNITSLQDLFTAWSREIERSEKGYKAVGPKIAVVHARGPIVDMSMGSTFATSMIMRDNFVETLEQVRKNKTIQAVVLRIDSPGGSAYASDIIWKKLKQLDEEKPVVVSMGTVAGSGGYYIACPGRLIFAQPTTITGSIGVLAILANQASAINRMDVNLAEMKRGERALLGSGHRDMKAEDRDCIQTMILETYEVFLDRVAEGRKMPKSEVRKLAGGRVYSGRDALEIGLVDRLGGLEDAIASARDFANIPASAEIKLVHYPRPATIGDLVESFAGLSMSMQLLEQAQAPANISFDRQLRYFAAAPKALCWMAIPQLDTLLTPIQNEAQSALELLGFEPARPAALP